MRGQRIRSALALAALATVVAACGDAAEPPATTQPPPATTAAATTLATPTTTTASTTIAAAITTTTTSTTTTTTTTPDDGVTRVDVTVANGAVVGGLEVVSVPVGEPVVLTVDADVADEVHLHGYDLFAQVGPGAPASIEFTADIPGIFEVELEGARLPVVELEVS